MDLVTDGATPIPRMVIVNELETEGGAFVTPEHPLFLAVGDLVAFDGRTITVTRADGASFTPAGVSGIRCSISGARPALVLRSLHR
ncbi:hypothetical protein OH807_33150 [Kitasatospora sp. NBC_01560]|uniref:hypothetical protein n=1 Tax=Kitasatospora sp. NBC_01560 TaxID=2975965 RepID=UPI003869D531